MSINYRAASSALVLLALAGCARMPLVQPLNADVAVAIQPVDVKLGIPQPELYAAFQRSNAGAAAAAGCGAVPGIGILLAAACGGTMGAIDASVNAARAKTADEIVRPLKDEIVDIKYDQVMNDALNKSLQDVPGMQIAGIAVSKTVTPKVYEELYRASTSNSVMFVNIDYHLSIDFSTLEVSARGLLYPRSAAARKAAGLSAELPNANDDPVLALKNSAYRMNFFYQVKLPKPAATGADNVANWKADGGRLLRNGLQDGSAQIARLMADDLQRRPGTTRPAVSKVDIGNGIMADLISQTSDGKLIRYADGSLHYEALVPASNQVSQVSQASAAASTPAGGATAQ